MLAMPDRYELQKKDGTHRNLQGIPAATLWHSRLTKVVPFWTAARQHSTQASFCRGSQGWKATQKGPGPTARICLIGLVMGEVVPPDLRTLVVVLLPLLTGVREGSGRRGDMSDGWVIWWMMVVMCVIVCGKGYCKSKIWCILSVSLRPGSEKRERYKKFGRIFILASGLGRKDEQ